SIAPPWLLPGPIRALAVSPAGASAAVSYDRLDNRWETRIFTLQTNSSRGSPMSQNSAIAEVAFEAVGNVVRTRDNQNVVRRWNIDSGRPANANQPSSNVLSTLAIDHAGAQTLFQGADRRVRLVAGQNTTPRLLEVAPGANWRAAAFATDGQFLLTA